jgi:hypothetical protein
MIYTRHINKGQYFWSKSRSARKILRSVRLQANEQFKGCVVKARFGGIFVKEEFATDIYEILMKQCGFCMSANTSIGVIIDT